MTVISHGDALVGHDRGWLAAVLDEARAEGRRIGLVPTMGALHAGHAELLRVGRAACDALVVTIFVNPLQFGAGEDLDRYPHTLDADLALCRELKPDYVWAPTPDGVYPAGEPIVRIDPGPGGTVLEGASRPGHFAGVLTAVATLFGLIGPEIAVFGEKDFQQLALIRRVVRDLDLPVDILGVPTVRDVDGLALSSRNRYLSSTERAAALAIPRALGSGDVAAARAVLGTEPGLRVDYCDLVDTATLRPRAKPPGRLVIAAYAGATRLIDNAALGDPSDSRATAKG